MRLVVFNDDRVGRIVGEHVFDVTEVVERLFPQSRYPVSVMRRAVANWGRLRERLGSEPTRGGTPLRSVQLRPPIPDPGKIIAAPVNFKEHMREMAQENDVRGLGVFLKAPSSLLEQGGTIQLPYTDRRFDQEGELAFVIARQAKSVPSKHAMDYVFGYTGLLDITMRGAEDRSTRKSFDTFTPMGPWLVTADELGDPARVELRCWVASELRQRAYLSDLIWNVPMLIAYASSIMTLESGDVISTGTPAGVGPLKAGDDVELELSGIGVLRAKVAADRAVHSDHALV